jgi:hypothetical protein
MLSTPLTTALAERAPEYPPTLPITQVYCRMCHCSVGYQQTGTHVYPVICHECVRSGRYRKGG